MFNNIGAHWILKHLLESQLPFPVNSTKTAMKLGYARVRLRNNTDYNCETPGPIWWPHPSAPPLQDWGIPSVSVVRNSSFDTGLARKHQSTILERRPKIHPAIKHTCIHWHNAIIYIMAWWESEFFNARLEHTSSAREGKIKFKARQKIKDDFLIGVLFLSKWTSL